MMTARTPPAVDPLVDAADRVARDAHQGQSRAHGTPYIDHPRAVHRILDALNRALDLRLDATAFAMALCHDVVEDSAITVDALGAILGPTVARGVGALSKPPVPASALDRDTAKARRDDHYYRVLREADDVVKLVKISDRIHNLS